MHALRVDQVGSMVRPDSLRALAARQANGDATDVELRRGQDEAIRTIVHKQEQLGLPVIGDGEFRRRSFMDSFAEVSGFDLRQVADAVHATKVPVRTRMQLVHNRPLDEYEFVQAITEIPAKITLLSADRVWQLFSPDESRQIYPNDEAFLADVVDVQRSIIAGLVQAGCQYVQLDGPGYAAYSDPSWIAHLRGRGLDPVDVLCRSATADAAAIAGFGGVTFGIHLCRGVAARGWDREATYEGTAEALFNSLPHDRLLLEYDTLNEGSFASLRFIPRDKVVVLGLISTRTPVLESEDDLVRRIDEAAQYLDIGQLAVSPQCGFSSGMTQGACSLDEQWRKLELMMRVAERVWS